MVQERLEYNILLHDTKNAVRFVNDMNTLDGDFDIHMGNYLFDAKSLLGVLSMDPRRIMKLVVSLKKSTKEQLDCALQPYIA